MNNKFLEVTEHNSDEVITDVCVQVMAFLDKLKAATTNLDGRDGVQQTPVEVGRVGCRRSSAVTQHAPTTGRGSVQSVVLGGLGGDAAVIGTRASRRSARNVNNNHSSGRHSGKVQPAPVIVHQTSFEKAMRVRMAELVESNDIETGSVVNRRLASQMASTSGHRTLWHLLYRSPSEEGMYDLFLNLRDPACLGAEKRSDYLSFKRSNGNIPLQNFFMALCAIYVGTRFWFTDDVKEYANNPTALAAILLAGMTALMSLSTLFLRLTHFSITYNIRVLQRFHPASVRFYGSPFGQCLDDGTVICAALAAGLHLVSHALAPVCPSGTAAMIHRDGCRASSISSEVMVLAVIIVVAFQLLARGVSRLGLVCAWIIMIVTINVSMWLAGSLSYLWINGELACVIALSYELERLPLRQFIKSVRVVEAAEVNAQLRVALSKYQVRETEQALEAKRSMVRHIGHEIRTPLNIIGVGTDVLLKELKQLGPAIPRNILEVVEGIEDASTAALEVVNELLEFEKLAAGMTTIEAVPTYIVRFLHKAMKQHLIPARAKEIDFKLSVETRDNELGVEIDPIKMTVVFRNIFR